MKTETWCLCKDNITSFEMSAYLMLPPPWHPCLLLHFQRMHSGKSLHNHRPAFSAENRLEQDHQEKKSAHNNLPCSTVNPAGGVSAWESPREIAQ